jgi:hypothetical protein
MRRTAIAVLVWIAAVGSFVGGEDMPSGGRAWGSADLPIDARAIAALAAVGMIVCALVACALVGTAISARGRLFLSACARNARRIGCFGRRANDDAHDMRLVRDVFA